MQVQLLFDHCLLYSNNIVERSIGKTELPINSGHLPKILLNVDFRSSEYARWQYYNILIHNLRLHSICDRSSWYRWQLCSICHDYWGHSGAGKGVMKGFKKKKNTYLRDKRNGAFSFPSTRHSSPLRGTRAAAYTHNTACLYTAATRDRGAFHKCHLYEQKNRIADVYFSSD